MFYNENTEMTTEKGAYGTMNLKKMIAVIMAALVIASFTGCGTAGSGASSKGESVELLDASEMFSGKDIEVGYDESECTVITLGGESARVEGKGASVSGGTVTVSGAGDYLISGKLTDGCIVVDADGEDKVRLIFKGVSINSSSGAAIYVKQADKVFITLSKESVNEFSNTEKSKITDDVDAVIFSKDDLTINGEGSLTVTANTGHAIVSKDDLVISGGVYHLSSEKKALDANNSIRVAGGSFTIDSGTDALHAEHEESDKGFIYIAGGSFDITSGTDAMDASGVIQIEGGSFNIVAGGGSANASTKKGGGFNDGWGKWGGKGKRMSADESGAAGAVRLSAASGEGKTGDSSESSSAKGLKSDRFVAINNGSFTIDSSDDAIHSNGNVSVADGTLSISSGDDGIHADSALKISGGSVTVSKSYEGLEGMTIDVSGGTVSVTASDDGLNAAGGNDQSSMNGRPGQNRFAAQEGVYISISGGSLTVDASGDGIDSNGDVKMSGGEVYVSGSTDNGNSAFDYNGEATITGGTFVAAGMSGMAQNFGSGSTQGAMLVSVGNQAAGSEVILRDSKGKTLVSFRPQKNYNSVVVSTPDIKKGSSYTLVTGSSETKVQMDSLIYGSGGGMGGGPGMGGRRR
jgi:hypothetical protein